MRLLIAFSLLLTVQVATAERSLYVDGFASILGDATAENNLLSFAVNRNIETLLLYELHVVHAANDLTSSTTNQVLADFIYKAKNTYGLTNIGAIAENAWFFANRIDVYNNTRTNALEKIDIYNLEFEFWVDNSVNSGGYYCMTYLQSGGFTCDNDGAFQFFIQELSAIKTLAMNNSHTVRTEAYVGWSTTAQAATIAANLDRVLVHAYVANPSTAFSYSENRLVDFANGNPNIEVSVIFSGEPAFMQSWLLSNDILIAENTFTSDWTTGSSAWTNNIDLVGFTYFAYSYMTNIVLPVELKSFEGKVVNEQVELTWTTSSEVDFDGFEIERKTENSTFETIGKVNAVGNSLTEKEYQFIDKTPSITTNYYRLKQINEDGTFEYSTTVSVAFLGDSILKIYPSVVKEMLFVTLPNTESNLFIFNGNGQLVKTVKTNGTRNFSINVMNLPKGIYFLKIGTETKRFVKQ